MNAGAYITGSQLQKLGQYYAKAIYENYGSDFDVLFGPAYKGIPLSVATVIAFSQLYGKEIRYCSNRKEAKDHGGDAGLLLGSSIKEGDKIVIIEDVTTSGKSIEETFPIIKAQCPDPDKIEIKGLMVSLNRQEKGKGDKSALEEITDLYGFPANAIVTMSEVVEYLYNKPTGKDGKIIIDDKIKADIENYYKEYGAK
jgi:orotate phosphoribosyltransferase